jgi:hypothetical protein
MAAIYGTPGQPTRLAQSSGPGAARIAVDATAWQTAVPIAIALSFLIAGASLNLTRPGFSSDEEITAVVVRGVADSGLPILPSGMLYLRGVPYSYAAWLAGTLFGHSLEVYRFVSVFFAALAVVFMYLLVRGVAPRPAAIVAALLLATFPPLIMASVTARFYTAFVAAALCAAWLLSRVRFEESSTPAATAGTARWFLVTLAAATLLHEFGMILALLPLCAAACAGRPGAARRWLFVFAWSVVLLIGVQAARVLLESWPVAEVGPAPTSWSAFVHAPLARPPLSLFQRASPTFLGATAIVIAVLAFLSRRATNASWLLLGPSAVCAFFSQTGAALVLLLVWLLARPKPVWRSISGAGLVWAGGAVLWLTYTFMTTDAQVSWAHGRDLVLSTSRYPWEAVAYVGELMPLVALAALGAIVMRIARPQGGDDAPGALTLFAVLGLIALGVSAGEFKDRYVLLIVPFVMICSALFVGTGIATLTARIGALGSTAELLVPVLATALMIGGQYAESETGPDTQEARLAPATNSAWQTDGAVRVSRHDLVVCNDELACVLYLGRVDYWLLQTSIADDYVTATRRSVYTGARVLGDAPALEAVICGRPRRGVSVLVFDSEKFGSDANRETALDLASRHGGTITSAGGRHLLVRFSPDIPHCEGDPS